MVAGGAAAVFTAMAAAPTDAATGRVSYSQVTVNGGKPIVIGIQDRGWEKHAYQGYAGRTVSLQFKADGASSYKTVKKVTSSSTGALKTTVKATDSGTWRWNYYGNSTAGAKASAGDHVAVSSGVRVMHGPRVMHAAR